MLFANNLSLALIDMTCVAMLLRIRWDLMEADYSTALTLLLRYSLPRSSPDKPVSLVRDAFYLDQDRTPQAGAKLVLHYSGKSPLNRQKQGGKDNRISTDLGVGQFSTSQKHNKPVPRQVGMSSPGRSAPTRFLPQQKGLESLFQEVSGNIQKRAEGWNLSKTIQGAVSEVKRNMNNTLATTPQRSRVPILVAEDLLAEDTEPPTDEALLKRVQDLEGRNKALAKMLDSALESLRSVKINEPEMKSMADDTLNIALAKIQFVSVYLSDPEIPIPPEEPVVALPMPATAQQVEEQMPEADKVGGLLSSTIQQAALGSSEAIVPAAKLDSALRRQPLIPVAVQQQSRRQQRPSLAESSFSFMLGEDRHRSSFVSSVADLPEQTRIEHIREAETRSRPKQMAAESKKEHQKERGGSESEDDGFTLTSLRSSTKDG